MMDLSLAFNAELFERNYTLWKKDPRSVTREWRIFFEGFDLGAGPQREISGVCDKEQVLRQARVEELVHRYRDLGHLLACLDPLSSCPMDHPLLSLEAVGLTEEDLDRSFVVRRGQVPEEVPLREIVAQLRETYCRSVGVEYMHLQDPQERQWLQDRMEPNRNRPELSGDSRMRILHKLCQATIFEHYLNKKYLGQKRFSVEGAEVVIAMLDGLVQRAAEAGVEELILGMAHRGRLNVQVNILLKLYEHIFCEFEDNYDPESLVGSGDVKYHKGYMADVATPAGRTLRIVLATNPSHLEAVNPVVEGMARARQDALEDLRGHLVLPVLIHGDAAFAGQGIVAETLNLSQLEGYKTGGTVHLVINNQIGFTTLPEDARSTRYSTDVAKMLMVPIFHVHGENPEAALHVMQLAFDYRRQFGKDVVVDVVCYRRYGHNEGDEPYFTQPRMYDRIRERPLLYRLYGEKLEREGVVSAEETERIVKGIEKCLDEAFESAHSGTCAPPSTAFYEVWDGYGTQYRHDAMDTAVPEAKLRSLAEKLRQIPEGFTVQSKLEKILDRRLECVNKGEGIDWANAESLAFASLLTEGVPIRLSGEDSRRGTFSQRHSVLTDPHSSETHTPLNHLEKGQAPFRVYDSLLSENAVLGFEYGYSLTSPGTLALWEAQFGDFSNNAQVIIDQFLVSGESKWQRSSGLVLLLPHGFEGQGAEHSSARLERYLQLCAQDNLQVCYPTTPAQYFHLLRRQVKFPFRKPLVVMTPKSLLRHPLAVSRLSEFSSGTFQEVLDDGEAASGPKRVLWCSGKIYYELLEKRREQGVDDTAILRVEQFYPFPLGRMKELASRYASASQWLWVQEEPENMGGWSFMRFRFSDELDRDVQYIGRAASPSPATGHFRKHKVEQASIIDKALGL